MPSSYVTKSGKISVYNTTKYSADYYRRLKEEKKVRCCFCNKCYLRKNHLNHLKTMSHLLAVEAASKLVEDENANIFLIDGDILSELSKLNKI